MDIVILTEGGAKTGFGHLSRCIGLAQAAEDRYPGHSVKFLINGDEMGAAFCALHGITPVVMDWSADKKVIETLIKESDAVIIDSHTAAKSVYKAISSLVYPRLLMMDDYNRLEYPQGLVANPDFTKSCLSYKVRHGVSYLLGKRYVILRREVRAAAVKTVNHAVKKILITFGGIAHTELAQNVRKELSHISDFEILTIEPGKNMHSAKDMVKLMTDTDICISGGGQTINELAYMGIPTIGICLFDNQRSNLESWQEAKFIEYAGDGADRILPTKVVRAVTELIPLEVRDARSKAGRAYIDGEGTDRLLNRLLQEL